MACLQVQGVTALLLLLVVSFPQSAVGDTDAIASPPPPGWLQKLTDKGTFSVPSPPPAADPSPPPPPSPESTTPPHTPQWTSSHGISYIDVTDGTGEKVYEGDTAWVYYSGWVQGETTLFDSTEERGGQPYEFEVGSDRVIPGFNLAVLGMRVGGKRQTIIPPDKGYGDRWTGDIPPGSTLVFNLTLIQVKEPEWLNDPSIKTPGEKYDDYGTEEDDITPTEAPTDAPTHTPNWEDSGPSVTKLPGSATQHQPAGANQQLTSGSNPPTSAPTEIGSPTELPSSWEEFSELMNTTTASLEVTMKGMVTSEVMIKEGAAGRVFTALAVPGGFVLIAYASSRAKDKLFGRMSRDSGGRPEKLSMEDSL